MIEVEEVLASNSWHIFFPAAPCGDVYVVPQKRWEEKWNGLGIWSHSDWAQLSITLEAFEEGVHTQPLREQYGLTDAENPFRSPAPGKVPMLFREEGLRIFVERVHRRISVYVYHGNMYYGYSIRPLHEASPRDRGTAYRG